MPKETDNRVMVAVTADLLARARLEDAAARAGWKLEIATADNLRERVESLLPEIVVLDLDAGREDLLARVADPRVRASLPSRTVGFFSHVDTDLAAAAKSAGCEVMPRGKLWRSLPALLADGPRNGP